MGQPAGVIEMKMGDDDVGYRFRSDTLLAQRIQDRAAIHGEDAAILFRPFSPAAGFDQHLMCAILQQQAVGIQLEAVVLIRFGQLRPDGFGHHAEHAPAIETEGTGFQKFPGPVIRHAGSLAEVLKHM
jgi:hypothetical protein